MAARRRRIFEPRIDTQMLIKEVSTKNLLWNKDHEMYRSKIARDSAWWNVAKKLISNFDDLVIEEKKYLIRKIQQRWRTARDTYKKDKLHMYKLQNNTSTDSGAVIEKRKYAYHNLLKFLDEVKVEAVDKSPGDVLSDDDDDDDDCTVQEFCEENDSDSASSSQTHHMTELFIPEFESGKGDEPSVLSPKREKIEVPTSQTQATECPLSSSLELDNDDLAFFQSLQPTLRQFSNYEKMVFRTKVMQVIMEMNHPENKNN